MLVKILSTGQHGVESAALDAAIKCQLIPGGWRPKGNYTPSRFHQPPEQYRLRKAYSNEPYEAEKLNIKNSEALLIILNCKEQFTSRLAISFSKAINEKKPVIITHLMTNEIVFFLTNESNTIHISANSRKDLTVIIADWIIKNKVDFLNVTGLSEIECGGIQKESYTLIKEIFRMVCNYELMMNQQSQMNQQSHMSKL